MFQIFPYYIGSGEITFVRFNGPTNFSINYSDLIVDILKSFQLINALRSLHDPAKNEFIDPDLDLIIRNKIVGILNEAIKKIEDIKLRNVLSSRAKAFETNNYQNSALFSSEQSDLPLEIIIGLLPSWRYYKKPKTYSALLGIPDYLDSIRIGEVTDVCSELINNLCKTHSILPIKPNGILPKQITCDLIALAGDLASHPIHIAHFLPEDEGVYNTQTNKTLIYRNLYVSRFKLISYNLFKYCISHECDNNINNDNQLWLILSNWFRGHDTGHIYFDQYCKLLPGIHKRKRYALQEALADLLGYFSTIKIVKDSADPNINPDQITVVYLSEMLRYMTRDESLFPDSKSAWIQFGYLIKEDAIKITEDGLLVINFHEVNSTLYRLFENTIINVLNKRTAYIENFIDYVSNIKDHEFKKHFSQSKTRMEIDPVFSFANNLLTKEIQNESEYSFRNDNESQEFDGRVRF